MGNTKWVCLPVLLWAIQNRPVYRRVFVSVYRRLCGQYKMGLFTGACVGNTKMGLPAGAYVGIQDGSACRCLCGQYKMGLLQNGSACRCLLV